MYHFFVKKKKRESERVPRLQKHQPVLFTPSTNVRLLTGFPRELCGFKGVFRAFYVSRRWAGSAYRVGKQVSVFVIGTLGRDSRIFLNQREFLVSAFFP